MTPSVWLLAIRPKTLPAAIGPVLVGIGAGIGLGAFRPVAALACLAVALLLQIAANLANDLFDFQRGADLPDRIGPVRVAASGLATVSQLRAAIGGVLAIAALAGLYLVALGGPVFLVLGGLAALSALAYTGGPWPYGYHGLGDLMVFIWFGLVGVGGTAFLQVGRLEPLALAAAIPMGCLVTAILVVNNLRDIATDAAANKRTLAVRLGRRWTVVEYAVLLGIAFVVPIGLVVTGRASAAAALPLLTIPTALPLVRRVQDGSDPRRLNLVLRDTARLSLVFAGLLAAGLAAGVR